MLRKTLDPASLDVDLKADGEGAIRAVISVFGEVDSDGDVTYPGSFPDGKTVDILFAHDWGSLPIGEGVISSDEKFAFVDGEIWHDDTAAAADALAVLRRKGSRQQWSYALEPVEWKMREDDDRVVRDLLKIDVFEASPVLVGALRTTHTVSVKHGDGRTLSDQSEATLAVVSDLIDRLGSLADLRAEEGRRLSEKHVATVDELVERLALLKREALRPDDVELVEERLRFERIRSRLLGAAV